MAHPPRLTDEELLAELERDTDLDLREHPERRSWTSAEFKRDQRFGTRNNSYVPKGAPPKNTDGRRGRRHR